MKKEELKEFYSWFKNIKNIKYHGTTSYLKKISKVLVLTTENFRDSKTGLWATTLSFYSIFSIVPILAIIFSIAKSLGFQEVIQREITKSLPLSEEGLDYVFSFTDTLLNSTKEGLLALIAILSLLWAIIRIFSLIEDSFNAIWKVENSRNIFRKTTDYTSIVVLVPLAMILSNIFSAYINIKITQWTNAGYAFNLFATLGIHLLKYTALITMCFLLSVIYAIIPNTKVQLSSAFLAGTMAGIATQFLQYFFLKFQFFLISYNAIYGSFAIIPIFLIITRLFWNIVLSGCHMSFISQNYYKYDYSLSPIKLSHREEKILSIFIMYILVNNFHQKKETLSTSDLAHELKLSINLTQSILQKLLKIGLINKIDSEDSKIKYQPAFDINLMTISFIEEKLETFGKDKVLEFTEEDKYYDTYKDLLDKYLNNKDSLLID